MDEDFLINYRNAFNFVRKKTYEKFFESKESMYDICVFGYGALGKDIVNWLLNENIRVKYISDNKSSLWGSCDEHGIPIISPSELRKKWDEVYVIIGVSNKNNHENERICEQLSEIKHIFRNPLGLTIYWNQIFSDREEDGVLFREAVKVFSEEYSRILYTRLWGYRMQKEVIDYPLDEFKALYSDNQYIATDIIDYKNVVSVVDVGAYTGDTLCQFIKNKVGKLFYCFEMDGKIYKELQQNVEMLDTKINKNIYVFNMGLSDRNKKINYESNLNGGSCVNNNADNIADMVSLDFLRKNGTLGKIDLIKMDIEGAEEDALKGMIETINMDHPILEISLYHNITQFVNIPLMLKRLDSNYRFFLRHHKNTADDTILYARYE